MKTARYLKFFIASLFIALLFILPQGKVFAQNYNYQPNSNYAVPETNPDVPKNLHTYSQSIIIEFMSSLSCIVAGVDPVSPKNECLGVDTRTGKIGYVKNNGGLIGATNRLIGMTFIPPAHVDSYVKNVASSFGIAKPALAAQNNGIGFEGIKPLVNIWSTFRNFTYIFFVIVFVLIGIAIMMRVKIDPRTVMSLQNQIPKIIIALVLITLSFAIAGFLIDLMWLSIYLILSIFSDPNTTTQQFDAVNASDHLFSTPFGFLNNILGLWGFGIARIPGSIMDSTFKIVRELLGVDTSQHTLVQIFNFLFRPMEAVKDMLAGLASFAAFLVVAIAIAISLFRLWFALIQAYVMILLDIIIAPLWILSGIIPGRSSGFGNWLRDILSNLSAFPATIFIFIIIERILSEFDKTPTESVFVPPLIGSLVNQDALKGVIAFGLILASPRIVNMTKAAFKAPKLDTSSVMRGLAAGAGVAVVPPRTAWKRLTSPYDPFKNRAEGKLRTILLGKVGKSGPGLRRRIFEGDVLERNSNTPHK